MQKWLEFIFEWILYFCIAVVQDIDSEIGRHQIIDHYEVAVGTDRRYPSTRNNIHPFIDVGLNKSHTFTDLNLIPKTATYYFTVRAFSVSTAMAEVTSNGIQVGHGAHVISNGEVDVQRYCLLNQLYLFILFVLMK